MFLDKKLFHGIESIILSRILFFLESWNIKSAKPMHNLVLP